MYRGPCEAGGDETFSACWQEDRAGATMLWDDQPGSYVMWPTANQGLQAFLKGEGMMPARVTTATTQSKDPLSTLVYKCHTDISKIYNVPKVKMPDTMFLITAHPTQNTWMLRDLSFCGSLQLNTIAGYFNLTETFYSKKLFSLFRNTISLLQYNVS